MSGVADAVSPVVARLDRRAPGARDFGLRFWDGSGVPPQWDAPPGLTLIVRNPVALSYALRQPNELGLGRARVTGALDVEGRSRARPRAARPLPRPAPVGGRAAGGAAAADRLAPHDLPLTREAVLAGLTPDAFI